MSDLTNEQLHDLRDCNPANPFIATMAAELLALRDDLKATEAALWQFADDRNWSDQVGCLQWVGKRHAIEYARNVVEGLAAPMSAPNVPNGPGLAKLERKK
jgi:hypothetical protein